MESSRKAQCRGWVGFNVGMAQTSRLYVLTWI